MLFLFQLVFLISFIFLVHSYLIYPLHLYILYYFRKNNKVVDMDYRNYKLPTVSCIISVYNEESIIHQKLKLLIENNYPPDKIRIFIGSDFSSDRSEEIITEFSKQYSNIYFFAFKTRRGKTQVINDLVEEAFKQTPKSDQHILLFTDANVLMSKDVISKLCRHFVNEEIALVDSKIIPISFNSAGISYSENQYLSLERKIKFMEGEVWGAMLGAFGGCFALRSTYFKQVPRGFLVDDFYISMYALQSGGKSINDLEAVCHEGMPDQLKEEFKRKARISAGNFQNLSAFYKVLFSKPIHLAYAFFSHKVLRWISPILILLMWISATSIFLLDTELYFIYWLCFTSLLVLLPLLDYFFAKVGVHIKLLRGLRYFLLMNLALLIGFMHYLKGIKKSSWEPPKRSIV